MADLYHNTRIRIGGPWLIDKKQLEELDSLLDQQLEKLSAYRNKKINGEVERTLSRRIANAYQQPANQGEIDKIRSDLLKEVSSDYDNRALSKQVVILLSGNRKLIVNSLHEAIEHAGVSDAEILELCISLKVADIEAELEFNKRFDYLSLNVTPETKQESRDLYSALRDWIANYQPPRWQQKWDYLRFIAFFVWLFFAWASFSWLAIHSKSSSPYEAKALELLQHGVTATNQIQAIETTLALQVGYQKTGGVTIPNWWIGTILLSFFAFVLFAIKPNSHVGLGLGTRRVKYWRNWICFITIGIPGFLFSSFLSPTLVNVIRRLFQ